MTLYYDYVKKIILFWVVISLFTICHCFAATQSTNPLITNTITPAPMILCPNFYISGTKLISSTNTINFSPMNNITTQDNWAGRAYMPMFSGGGGTNGLQCPADHPYLEGFWEDWDGWGGGIIIPFPIFLFWFQISWTFRCSTTPQPPMYIQQGNQGSVNTWVQGTHCD